MSEKFKNLLLLLLIFISIFFSSHIWLELFPSSENNVENADIKIDIWHIVIPVNVELYNKTEYYLFGSECSILWESSRDIILETLKDNIFTKHEKYNNINLSSKYITFNFGGSIPSEIMLKGLNIDNMIFIDNIFQMKSITIDLENKKTFITNDIGIYEFDYSNDLDKILIDVYNKVSASTKDDYANSIIYKDYKIDIAVPYKEEVINPIFVKSEIDIEDNDYIESIAKQYFKEGYDYARKTVENNGNINYIYKNEKVIKIYKEGLLEFYDSAGEFLDETNVYKSFEEALRFSESFLGLPENIYLSDVNKIIEKGKSGYRFVFSYKVLEKPVIFSQVRDEKAMQIDVISGKVIFYQRFIRVIDNEKNKDSVKTFTITPLETFDKNLDLLTLLYIENDEAGEEEYYAARNKIINSIEKIYLAYYDPSRKAKDQVLRSVWVIETDETRYIFNAISGIIIEEQKIR